MASISSSGRRDLKLGTELIRSSGSAPIVGASGVKDEKIWEAGDDWATLTGEVYWSKSKTSAANRRAADTAVKVCIAHWLKI
jgi:hypothetical protein